MRKIIISAFFILLLSASMVSAMQPVIVPGQNIHSFGSRATVTNELDVYNWTSAFQNFKLIEQWQASTEVFLNAVIEILIDMGNDITVLQDHIVALYNNLDTIEAELPIEFEMSFSTGNTGNGFGMAAYPPASYEYVATVYSASSPSPSSITVPAQTVTVTIPQQTVNITDSGGDTASVVIPQQTPSITIPAQTVNFSGNFFAVQRTYHDGTNFWVYFTCAAPFDGKVHILVKKK